ncbi:aldo/keto reductase [Microvirga mediterraneensis]|uniref:Aldo/keto reductase n=1 Tax=Microvirga mediterraneensis TaxID=2754695 RepID=A0A838BM09_9HYPH|nr:aldo/keto reductase [Microvirga mediterraneensis]MBA1156119.1 aldo/keto reductase [Microvirga mediterraneensis]
MRISDRRTLPRKELSLTMLGLGSAPMGGLFSPTSFAEAEATTEAAWAHGIRYFDTAPYYGYTRSERRLGALLCDRERDSYVLSTKAGRLMVPDGTVSAEENGWVHPLPFRPVYDYTYDAILKSFEDSRQRLGILKIDILYIHDIGRYTHGDRHEHYWRQLTAGGGFRALRELRGSGHVTAIGLGVNEAEVVHDAMGEADLDVVMLAGRYTLLEQMSLPLLEECARVGTGIVIAGPFNSGILAGSNKFDYADAPPDVVRRVHALKAVCDAFDVPLPAAAFRFPLAHPAVVSCVTGARDAEQLHTNVAWFEKSIPDELWTALREAGLLDEAAPLPRESE